MFIMYLINCLYDVLLIIW